MSHFFCKLKIRGTEKTKEEAQEGKRRKEAWILGSGDVWKMERGWNYC